MPSKQTQEATKPGRIMTKEEGGMKGAASESQMRGWEGLKLEGLRFCME